ncbi:hypothetical protein KI659_17315 [Litoribacter alkaliphilus]|uniref:Alpha/beta hydrolase n=1 Tax=Litoribacter ruber TaxID=702568 RepID=A0AAP2CJC9_9BACT|nr:alpha/beta hydrolase-fold protein [Litoribacter alkaliphilus]MBS9525783.1 hypothetical protein [Litoribacter alkaliphilus]
MFYDSEKSYPVIYVLDAEWRLDLIRAIAYDMEGNKRIPYHIIVGIPHEDWEYKRGIDLTFTKTKIEFDGSISDSSQYTDKSAGGGIHFLRYLKNELVIDVDEKYSTNGYNILIGHSYGGYFGSYILPLENPFSAFQIYDPSIWYSNGEVISHLTDNLNKDKEDHIFITYQNDPSFDYNQIKKFIDSLSYYSNIRFTSKEYFDETHNFLFMYSFIDGMKSLHP